MPTGTPGVGARSRRPVRPRPGLWLLRIVRHRAGTQWRLLAVTATVALLVATLVATLALVLHLTENRGVGQALASDPERARLTVSLGDLDVSVTEASEGVSAAVSDILGAPVALDVHATSDLYGVARPGMIDALAYVDRRDSIESSATLVDGTWPGAWAGGDEPVPVAAPVVGAQAFDLEVGDTLVLKDRIGEADVVVRIDGLYEVAYPDRTDWGRDRLGGWAYSDSYPVPGSGGFLSTEAFGPLVASAETVDSGVIQVLRSLLRVAPDLSEMTAADLPALRTAADTMEDEVGFRVDALVGGADVSVPLRFLLRDTMTGVVVTRAGVAVAAVILLLVAFAALLQTARLVADARNAEHDLMRARGASRAHLVAALVVETGTLGVLVGVAGPVLAPLLLRAPGGPLADGLTGGVLDGVRALPWTAWAAGGVVALMLVAATLVPLLGAPATFVEGQQARGRAPWAGSLARLAADAVVVALAVGAWLQLRSYGGLLVGSGAGLTVDPVLVVGPALLLLAAVLVGVRVLTLVTRLAERGAARGRGVVLPLAGWELGRRPRQAATAVLLLAVALGAATFGLTQSATWETSQRDQAAFAVGAPAVVDDDGMPGTDAGALLAGGARPEPVARGVAHVGQRRSGQADLDVGFSGVTTQMLAATGPARAMLDVGRLGTEGGATVAALPAPGPTTGGIDLGDQVVGIEVTIEITGTQLPVGPAVVLRAVIEDGAGVLSTVELGMYPLEARTETVAKLLPEVRLPAVPTAQQAADRLSAAAALRSYPLRLVGLQAIVVDNGMPYESYGLPYDADIMITELAALRPAENVSAVDPADWVEDDFHIMGEEVGVVRDPIEVPADRWEVAGDGLAREGDAPIASPLWVRAVGTADLLAWRPTMGAVVAWEPVLEIPAVVSSALAEHLGPDVEMIGIKAEGVVVRGVVSGVVEHVPTLTDRLAVAVDRTALSRLLAQGGASATLVDEWWVDAPDADAWAAALPADAAGRPLQDRVTTRTGATQELLEHPLRASTPVVLGLLALGGAVVAAVGFAVHTAVSVRGRGLELAQLRAVGLTRGRLTTVLGLEVAVLAALGVVLGLAAGTGVTGQVTRLLISGADGAAPIPAVVLAPARGLGWVAVVLAVVVGVLATGIAAAQRAANPAELLRAGESR
ncbi:FtsX-like permease family protein [Actinotalea fermentans]|uniref:FtsX-like permease family protein n=1 Tax=Actinotalea fermentans TaxID=43671 RepID=UPI0011BEDADB|nr:FtsX-like permease family protein [Actinotalea fermentans]